ncbi:MAG: hypothetical protein COA65_00195 [Rhodospirillaceae bacterium]|nr:MAG: hypothetical protein COA65_00195 [Rhodospirillaceae bacterium]
MNSKVCLVINGTGYGGPAATKALLDDGWKVFCSDQGFADAESRKAFTDANPDVEIIDELEPEKAIEAVVKKGGRIDLLFSNSFVALFPAAVETAGVDAFQNYLEGLTIEPFRLARAAIPHMKKQKSGKIIFMTSAGPIKGLPNLTTYCAARGGANALAKSLAQEVAADNIQVNAICPNFAENPTYFPAEAIGVDFMQKLVQENCPTKRFGTPEELGALVVYLASEGSNFTTSQMMPFAGGWA